MVACAYSKCVCICFVKRFKRSLNVLRYTHMKIRHYVVCRLNIKVHSMQGGDHPHSYLHHNVTLNFYIRCFYKTYLNKIPTRVKRPCQLEEREIYVHMFAFGSLDHPCTSETSVVIKKRNCPCLPGRHCGTTCLY